MARKARKRSSSRKTKATPKAKAAKAAGLPGIDPEAARKCNDKLTTRQVFKLKKVDKIKIPLIY